MKTFLLVLILLINRYDKNSSSFNQEKLSADDGWQELFNKKDLSGWSSYLRPKSTNPAPESVFSVVGLDGEKVIRVSGEAFGILYTRKNFSNYHLSVQFKWGEAKFEPRKTRPRDSGVLYNSVGKPGSWDSVWMKSIEFQVMEGNTGYLVVVDSTSAEVPVKRRTTDNWNYYEESGEWSLFDRVANRRTQVAVPADYEKPHGEWNTLEVYSIGDESFHVVNGKVVMHARNEKVFLNGKIVPLTGGAIQLQSEGAEVYYRNVRLKNISTFPKELLH